MNLFTRFIYCALLLLSTTLWASQDRKVMVVGIDGVRSDALQQANTPTIDNLIANGLYSYDAWHMGITVSAPSWSSIMCGVWEAKHGVTSNAYTGSNYNQYPYFTTRAKELLPDLYCVQVTEWAPMSNNVFNDGWNEKIIVPDGATTPTTAAAIQALQNDNLDCLFVYYDACDLAGHASGFSPLNPVYMNALQNVDASFANVLEALYNRPNYANENWLILLITDHGGIGTGHGGGTDEERHIWWIASGTSVPQMQITAPDPGSYQYNGIPYFVSPVNPDILATTPVQTDIGVTALHHLIYETGTNPQNVPTWNLDGKSWLSTFTSDNNNNLTPQINTVKVYPNPSQNLFTVWFPNQQNLPASYILYNQQGQICEVPVEWYSANKITFNTQALSSGIYYLVIKVGMAKYTQRVVIQ